MKKTALMFLIVIGFISGLPRSRRTPEQITNRTPENHGVAMQTTGDKLIAIDVLIEPDQTMIGKAQAVNARLRENLPVDMSWTLRMRRMSRCCSVSCEPKTSTR